MYQKKNVIFLLNSIMVIQLWIRNLRKMDYAACVSWRHTATWVTRRYKFFRAVFVKTARFMEYCGRRGLEGGYVRALIKYLIPKNKKGKAISLFSSTADGHRESDHRVRGVRGTDIAAFFQTNKCKWGYSWIKEPPSLANHMFILLMEQM